VYHPDEQLTGYFEIYGLELDGGRASYQVTYTFAPRTPVRDSGWFPNDGLHAKPAVSSSFTAETTDSRVRETLRVEIGSLQPDDYDLVLTIRDLRADREATTRTRFRVAP
jgi:hypothetical protein